MIETILDTLLSALVWGSIGALIGIMTGWKIPQPPWAAWVQDKLTQAYRWVKSKF
jgi:hypothetical protein